MTTYNYGGALERWDLTSLADDVRSAQLGDTVFALTFRGDTHLLAAVDEKRLVTLDARRLAIVAEQQNAFLLPVVLSDDGTTLASSAGEMLKEVRLQVVALGDGARRERPRCRAIPAVSARYVVCSETPRLTLLLDASTLREVSRLATQTEITSAAFSPGSDFLVTVEGETATLRSLPRLERIATLPPVDRSSPLAVGKGARRIAALSDDETAFVWDRATNRKTATIVHEDLVSDIRFSPDESVLATASYDRTVRVTDVDGAELVRIRPRRPMCGLSSAPPAGSATTSGGSRAASR